MQSYLFTGSLVTSKRILYTPSEFARTSLLHLQEIGSLKVTKPHTSGRQNLSSYLFFIVEQGSGTLTYENHSYSLKTGDCVFIDCRKAYSHCSGDDLWTLRWAHFYGPNIHAIYKKYKERGGLTVFPASTPSLYSTLLTEVYDIAESTTYIRDMKIFEKLTSLLVLIMEESWHPGSRTTNPHPKRDLQEIKEYIDRNFTEEIRLDDLAEKFYINKYYLTRVFKEQFGITITHYQIQFRITHAKHLLRFSDHPIDKISAECGIDDPNYFSRLFKKIEGLTPNEYRSKW